MRWASLAQINVASIFVSEECTPPSGLPVDPFARAAVDDPNVRITLPHPGWWRSRRGGSATTVARSSYGTPARRSASWRIVFLFHPMHGARDRRYRRYRTRRARSRLAERPSILLLTPFRCGTTVAIAWNLDAWVPNSSLSLNIVVAELARHLLSSP